MKSRLLARLMACGLALVVAGRTPFAAEPITVFAAASLGDALEVAGRIYYLKTGVAVRFSFASSSTLARQITAGAPADIFISASEAWMDDLEHRDLIETNSRIAPIGNSLVMIAPVGSRLNVATIDASLDIAGLLGDGRLAMGDPAHVPAGIYARQALESLGLWKMAAARLAPAGDVRGALVLVERSEVPLGIVYRTDAIRSGKVSVIGAFPDDSHQPIVYSFAIVHQNYQPEIVHFFDFVTGTESLNIFERFGFHVSGADRH